MDEYVHLYGKVYKVHMNEEGRKYVSKNLYLDTIRRRYRYIKDPMKVKWLQRASSMMDKEGNINELDAIHEIPCFRKYFADDAQNEREIAMRIWKKQKKGHYLDLIRILEVTDEYYDAELLDLYHGQIDKRQIKSNLKKLHELDVIYVDLKVDNMGYSVLDDRWKLFDFDCSGIAATKSRWKSEPPFYYAYKTAFKTAFGDEEDIYRIQKGDREIVPLENIDWILYKAL